MARTTHHFKRASARYKAECLKFGLLEFIELVKSVSSNYAKALDLGCGYGYVALRVARYFQSIVAVDLNDDCLKKLIETARRSHILNIEPMLADAHNLLFKDRTFDLGILRLCLIDAKDPFRVLAEMHRVLKPNSCLVLSEVILPQDIIPVWTRLGILRYGYKKNFFDYTQLVTRLRTQGFTIDYMTSGYELRDLDEQAKMLGDKPEEFALLWRTIDRFACVRPDRGLIVQKNGKYHMKYEVLNIVARKHSKCDS